MIVGALAVVAVIAIVLFRRKSQAGAETASSRLFRALAASADGEWPLAMLGEHGAIEDRHDRSQFARGAVFALVTQRPTWRSPARWPGLAVNALLIALAMALASVSLVHYPGLRVGTAWVVEVGLFVLGLGCYAAATLVLSHFGTAKDHAVGTAVGLMTLGVAWVAGFYDGAPSVLLASLVILMPALAVLFDCALFDERGTVWVAGAICALTAGLAFFGGFVAATLVNGGGTPTPLLVAEAMRSGIHPYSAWAVGDSLGGASFMLVYVLVVGGVIGLGAGMALRPGHTSSAH
jgi:hypothetical protein